MNWPTRYNLDWLLQGTNKCLTILLGLILKPAVVQCAVIYLELKGKSEHICENSCDVHFKAFTGPVD